MNTSRNTPRFSPGNLKKKLSETERNYQEIFNSTYEAILIHDSATGRILDVNDAMLTTYGYDNKEEVMQGNIGNLSANEEPFTEERAQEYILKAINEGPQCFDWKSKKKTGETFWTEVSLKKTQIGGQGRILAIVRDISETRLAKEALQRQKRFFEQIFLQSSVSTQILDKDGWCERINPELSKLFGVRPEDIEGKVYNIFQDKGIIEGGVVPYLKKVFEEGIPVSWEVNFDIGLAAESQNIPVKEKKKAWFRNWAFPVYSEEGQLEHVIIQHMNINEQKELVSELVKSKEKAEQSDRLKTAFLNNLSHEIRTPLNAISGFSQFLNDPGLDAARIEHITGIICRSSDQLLAIMNDIISISTIEAGVMETNNRMTNINTILKNVHEQLQLKAAAKGISLRFFSKLSETDASALTDETKLTQVITNLVDNAIKFTRFGYVEYGCVLKEDTFLFSVTDTGTGIPEKLHSVIFERFQQLDIGQSTVMSGLGLGLPIAKSYVELMGGQIWLESGQEKGTRFYFTLPRMAGEKARNVAKPPTGGQLKRNPVILVAEDEENNFELTRVVLSMLGVEVLHAWDGVQAVKMCEENPEIDMVLMDIKMPLMNGYEATRLIKEKNNNLPVVALTAYALPGDREKALNAGCNDYLPKPVSLAELKNLVRKYLPKTD